jgi:hypothetical protein
LVDATWATGHDFNGEFRREFDNFYFMPPPDQYICSHFPDSTEMQCLSPPLTLQEFASTPRLKSVFWKAGMGLKSHTNGVIKMHASEVTLDLYFDHTSWRIMSVYLCPKSSGDRTSLELERNENIVSITIKRPKMPLGDYELCLFAVRMDASTGWDAIEYLVKMS